MTLAAGLLPCAICEKLLSTDGMNEPCSCGESICEGCPAFACACTSYDPEIQDLRSRLRQTAEERAELANKAELSTEEQSLLQLLHEVTESLREEINRKLYPEDFEE